MKKSFSLVLALGISVLFPNEPVMAFKGPVNAFTAVFEVSAPQGKSLMQIASDGKGHVRTETRSKSGQFTTIKDYQKSETMALVAENKTVLKTALAVSVEVPYDDNALKLKRAHEIGKKTILGHPCTGYAYDNAGSKTEVWMGNDIHYTVQATVTTRAGKVVTRLKKYSPTSPPQSLFELPKGYKINSKI